MKLNILKLDTSFMSQSILGNAFESLEHALLRFVKSTHIQNFHEFFFTINILSTQVGHLISWMNLAYNKIFSSFSMANLFSSPSFYFI